MNPTRLLAFAALLTFTQAAYSFGTAGHELVGAVADQRIKGSPTAQKVHDLLDGLSLEDAATLPDRIKDWDHNGVSDLFHGQHAALQADLAAFWEQNHAMDPENGEALHHVFHYTDVPIEEQAYAAGAKGRSVHDIVHMIPYCIRVLRGDLGANNPLHISKRVAVVLLAHYLGDLHQPLHVGAEYFDVTAHTPANPDTDPDALPDVGGNTINLHLPSGTVHLHSFWDTPAVNAAKQQLSERFQSTPALPQETSDQKLARLLAQAEPPAWHPAAAADALSWAESWADEILPTAREAHSRLSITNIKRANFHGRTVAGADAADASPAHDYEKWAGQVTAGKLQLAGWRLALVLETALH
jgi:hypothetical protein